MTQHYCTLHCSNLCNKSCPVSFSNSVQSSGSGDDISVVGILQYSDSHYIYTNNTLASLFPLVTRQGVLILSRASVLSLCASTRWLHTQQGVYQRQPSLPRQVRVNSTALTYDVCQPCRATLRSKSEFKMSSDRFQVEVRAGFANMKRFSRFISHR